MPDNGDGAPCAFLQWDSEFWQFPVARLLDPRLPLVAPAIVDAWCHDQDIRCLYALVDPLAPRAAVQYQGQAYVLVDERVTLTWQICSRQLDVPLEVPDGVVVRSCASADLEPLQQIAAESHTDTRFFADTRFPRLQAQKLYALWIANSCAGFAEHVLVAELAGAAVGYCSCHVPAGDPRAGSIGLIAVAPAARGLGVGQALVTHAQRWFANRDLDQVSVVSQGRNAAALRLYRRCGFSVQLRQHWYHRWFAERTGARI